MVTTHLSALLRIIQFSLSAGWTEEAGQMHRSCLRAETRDFSCFRLI